MIQKIVFVMCECSNVIFGTQALNNFLYISRLTIHKSVQLKSMSKKARNLSEFYLKNISLWRMNGLGIFYIVWLLNVGWEEKFIPFITVVFGPLQLNFLPRVTPSVGASHLRSITSGSHFATVASGGPINISWVTVRECH